MYENSILFNVLFCIVLYPTLNNVLNFYLLICLNRYVLHCSIVIRAMIKSLPLYIKYNICMSNISCVDSLCIIYVVFVLKEL